jgi:hypothetical protein
MKQNVKITAGLGLVVLVSCGYLLLSRQAFNNTAENTAQLGMQPSTVETAYQENAAMAAQMSALKQEIAGLKSEIQAIKALLQTPKESPDNTRKADAPNRQPHPSRAQGQTLATQQARDLGIKLDGQFRQQTTDKAWSEQTQAMIKSALSNQQISDDDVVALECRLNTCRVELANDANNNPPDISNLPFLVGQHLPYLTVDNQNIYEGAANTTVVYLSNQPVPVDK